MLTVSPSTSKAAQFAPFTQVRSLDVILVTLSILGTLLFQSHINNINQCIYFHLRNINPLPQFSFLCPTLCALCLPPWGAELSWTLMFNIIQYPWVSRKVLINSVCPGKEFHLHPVNTDPYLYHHQRVQLQFSYQRSTSGEKVSSQV